MTEIWHGTHGGYCNHKCRCDLCSAAAREYRRSHRPTESEHIGEYSEGCRCPACIRTHRAEYMRSRRHSIKRDLVDNPASIQHGRVDSFKAGCRCAPCADAHDRIRLAYYYSLTMEGYQALLAKQNGVCAVCGASPERERRGMLGVDHDHATGVTRGLLCSTCNTGIGKLGDTIDGLKRAITYLETVEKRMNSAKISL